MKDIFIQICTPDKQPIDWRRDLPPHLSHYEVPGSAAYHVPLEGCGHVILQRIYHQTCEAWTYHSIIDTPGRFYIKSRRNSDAILFYYIMKGRFQYRSRPQHIHTSTGSMNAIMASVIDHEQIFEQSGEYSTLNVMIPLENLRPLQDSFPVVDDIFRYSELEEPVSLLRADQTVNLMTRELVTGIRKLSFSNTTEQKALPAQIKDLVAATLDMLSYPLPMSAGQLREDEFLLLNKIRIHLLLHIHEPRPPRLPLLAKMAGVNDKKLEEQFKQAFNFTLLDYFNNARMNAIYRRLQSGSTNLSELGTTFGYSSYSNFSLAVKYRFGKSPSDIKRAFIEDSKKKDGHS